MSLSRQLIISILLLFIVLFIGTLSISINNTRTYLVDQLASHAEDAATSLGLSLTPAMRTNDLPTMNSMVDAIFDRGYYREINIIAINGTPMIQRKLEVSVEGVPAWFVDMVPLATPEGRSTVSRQWQQAATVQIYSHPGYAYLELWRNTMGTFWWFLFSFTVGVALYIIALRYILAPLKQVEQQAIAVTRREFPVMERLPWTKELRQVVLAMNRMSRKVKQMLTEQTDTIERMRKEAYVDDLTEMPNRRSFDMQLEHLVKALDEINQGAVLLIRLKDIVEINNTQGYAAGDALIKQSAEVIRRCAGEITQAFIARTAGGEFGIVLPGIDLKATEELAGRIAYELPLIEGQPAEQGLCHIGGAWYSGETSRGALLSKADMALQASLRQGPNGWQVYGMDEAAPAVVHGAQDWKRILKDCMAQGKTVFYRQAVKSLTDGEVLHYELFTRLLDEQGEQIPAMAFMPMAERLGLMPDLDRHIVKTLMGQLKQADDDALYAVNLSPSSIHDEAFVDWACAELAAEPELAQRLIFETSEYAAVSNTAAFKRLVARFQAIGCRFSLDHFGTAFAPFGYLHDLKLDVIKIHGGLVRGVNENRDNRFFIQSLSQIAHGLDVQVIGEFVESEPDWQQLKEIGLNGAQGYYVGQPEGWPG